MHCLSVLTLPQAFKVHSNSIQVLNILNRDKGIVVITLWYDFVFLIRILFPRCVQVTSAVFWKPAGEKPIMEMPSIFLHLI